MENVKGFLLGTLFWVLFIAALVSGPAPKGVNYAYQVGTYEHKPTSIPHWYGGQYGQSTGGTFEYKPVQGLGSGAGLPR